MLIKSLADSLQSYLFSIIDCSSDCIIIKLKLPIALLSDGFERASGKKVKSSSDGTCQPQSVFKKITFLLNYKWEEVDVEEAKGSRAMASVTSREKHSSIRGTSRCERFRFQRMSRTFQSFSHKHKRESRLMCISVSCLNSSKADAKEIRSRNYPCELHEISVY